MRLARMRDEAARAGDEPHAQHQVHAAGNDPQEKLASAGFRILRSVDCREEFLEMAGQMILDGDCSCLSPAVFAALRKRKTGYGLWIAERTEEK